MVEELIYLGDHVRTRVNVCGTDEFIVKIPNAQGYRLVKKGQQIQLGWSSDDCRALDPFE
jgi:putative spermidine/putrescine transport system ATP-binding protein